MICGCCNDHAIDAYCIAFLEILIVFLKRSSISDKNITEIDVLYRINAILPSDQNVSYHNRTCLSFAVEVLVSTCP